MTILALALVLLSAVLHATWNLFAKRAGGGALFIWLADMLSVVAIGPVVVIYIFVARTQLGLAEIGMMVGSGALHLAYFIFLFRGYRLGDFSLVYPLARGTGPLLATLGAVVLFAERPGILALLGALLIASGAFFLTGGRRMVRRSNTGRAVLYGLLTGVTIGAYTLWDKAAVSGLMVAPLLQYYGSTVTRVGLLAPMLWNERPALPRLWRDARGALLAVGLLGPVAYILVLTALTFTAVSYVAPAREISILLAALLGSRILSEGDAARRFLSSTAMVGGVVALALG